MVASHKQQHRKEERKALANIKEISKYFFSYAWKKLMNRSTIDLFTKENEEVSGDLKEMADVLKR